MPDPLSDAVVLPKKRVAVFLDGTWNTVNDNTNVWRLKSLLAPHGRDSLQQLSCYSAGVGTTFEERFRGGMFGYGLNDEIIRSRCRKADSSFMIVWVLLIESKVIFH